jgi:CRISPR-associated protein Csb2
VDTLRLERLTAESTPALNLRPDTWKGPARCWASVTPVLLDRFPKRGGRGVQDIIARGCEHVGLPRPAEVVAGHHSPLYGVEPSFRFLMQRPAGPGAKARLYTHVTLAFAEPVRGPLVLGAGRYFGLGLLRPLKEGNPG